MELFITYQAVLCLIVASLGISLGWVLGARNALQGGRVSAPGSSAIEQAGITTDGTSLERWLSVTLAVKELTDAEKERFKSFLWAGTTLEEKREADEWEELIAKWVSEQTAPFTARTATAGALRLQDEQISAAVLTRVGMALRKIRCTRIGTDSATCLYVPPQIAHPEQHHDIPAQRQSRHTRPSRIDTPAGSGPASTRPLQPQAQATQAAFSAPSGAGQSPSQ